MPEEVDSADISLCSAEEEHKGRLLRRQQDKEDVKHIILYLFPFRGADTGSVDTLIKRMYVYKIKGKGLKLSGIVAKQIRDRIERNIWAFFTGFLLDTNSPSILPQLSTNQPYSPRRYAGFSDFHSKKVKKVCDNNLTYSGYGRLNMVGTFDALIGV